MISHFFDLFDAIAEAEQRSDWSDLTVQIASEMFNPRIAIRGYDLVGDSYIEVVPIPRGLRFLRSRDAVVSELERWLTSIIRRLPVNLAPCA